MNWNSLFIPKDLIIHRLCYPASLLLSSALSFFFFFTFVWVLFIYLCISYSTEFHRQTSGGATLDGDESQRTEEERLGCGRSASHRVSLQVFCHSPLKKIENCRLFAACDVHLLSFRGLGRSRSSLTRKFNEWRLNA